MNHAEFLADLQTKVLAVGPSSQTERFTNGVQRWTTTITEMGQRGTVKTRPFEYYVRNPGVVAGPQVYANDVLDEDGVTVLHTAGDPILDENGVQIDINPLFAETADPVSVVELPVGDALTAVAYLEAQKAAGTFSAYEYESGRSDLDFFFAKVWVDNGDGTESEKRIRVTYDAQGAATHVEIV